VPTRRRDYLWSILPLARVVWLAVALTIWAWGVVEFVTGSYFGGGALVFTGGLMLVIWACGGLRQFLQAVSDWLGGP
jgi:hypothetical protein